MTDSGEEYFVYILKSISNPAKTYVGYTKDINQRLDQHNYLSGDYSKRIVKSLAAM
jgi:predicted GIY-YIG superfamily endonuclease